MRGRTSPAVPRVVIGLVMAAWVGLAPAHGQKAGPDDDAPIMENVLREEPSAPAGVEPRADDAHSPPDDEGWDLEVVFRAGAWLARPGGDFSLDGAGGTGTTFLMDPHFGVDDLEPTFNGDLGLSFNDRWRLRASGFDFSTSARAQAGRSGRFGDLLITQGDAVAADLDMWSAAFELSWAWFRLGDGIGRADHFRDGDPREAAVELRPVVGARWVEVEQSITDLGTGARESASGDWLALTAGLELHLEWAPPDGLLIGRALRLEAGGAIGPAVTNDLGFVWQVRAGAALEVIDHAEIFLGYRLLELDVEDGGYDFGGGVQGLFVGGTIRF